MLNSGWKPPPSNPTAQEPMGTQDSHPFQTAQMARAKGSQPHYINGSTHRQHVNNM